MSLPPEFASLLPQTSAAVTGKPLNPAAGKDFGGLPLQIGPWNTGATMPPWLSNLLAGTGQGMTTIARHAGNLAGGVLGTSNADLKRDAKLDAPLLKTGAGQAGQFLGETAALAPVGLGAEGALGKLGAMGIRAAASPVMSGMAQGAAQGFLSADPGNRVAGTLAGGLTGGVLPTVGAGIGKLARGITRTPAAQTLLDEGVRLTPGQMNPTGVFNRMEQSAEALPVVGDLAQNARENAMRQYTRAMVERSMAPGATLSPNVHDFNDMVDEAAKSFDSAYDKGKGFPVGAKVVTSTAHDVPLSTSFKGLSARARAGMTNPEQGAAVQHVQDLLSQVIKDAKQSGGMKSDDLIAFRSQLRELGRGEDTTTNAGRAKASLYKDAADKVTEALRSQLPTDAMKALDDADAQYGKFAVIRDAAKATKDAPNGPTPFQVSTAIAKNTPPNLYARGGGANRDLAKAAREVFQSNVPRTGFTGVGRVLLPLAAAGGAGAAGAAMMNPHERGEATGASLGTLGTLAALGALAYSPAGRDAFAGNTAVQQALAGALDRGGSALSPIARQLLGLYGRSALEAHLAPRLQAQ